MAVGIFQATADMNLIVGAKGLLGVITINGAEGPVAMRGIMQRWVIIWMMLVNLLAARRLSVVAIPRGAVLRATRPRLRLPLTLPSALPSVSLAVMMVGLESIGVPLCGVGPLTAPPPLVVLLRGGGIEWKRPPHCQFVPVVIARPAVTGETSAVLWALRMREVPLGTLRLLVMSSLSCSGWGKLLLIELVMGILTCQSPRDWLIAEFGGGILRLGRRAPSWVATGSMLAKFVAIKFEGPTLGLGLLPTSPPAQFVGLR